MSDYVLNTLLGKSFNCNNIYFYTSKSLRFQFQVSSETSATKCNWNTPLPPHSPQPHHSLIWKIVTYLRRRSGGKLPPFQCNKLHHQNYQEGLPMDTLNILNEESVRRNPRSLTYYPSPGTHPIYSWVFSKLHHHCPLQHSTSFHSVLWKIPSFLNVLWEALHLRGICLWVL